jgi:hypothetical protein
MAVGFRKGTEGGGIERIGREFGVGFERIEKGRVSVFVSDARCSALYSCLLSGAGLRMEFVLAGWLGCILMTEYGSGRLAREMGTPSTCCQEER